MNANVEFDEIRPYHDEELPQVYEELIADAAFRQAVDTVMPGVPFEVWSQKMRACKTKLEFQKTFCYGLLWKLAKEATDGLTLDHTALPADKPRRPTEMPALLLNGAGQALVVLTIADGKYECHVPGIEGSSWLDAAMLAQEVPAGRWVASTR